MTVHASKGLEFKYVFVTGLEDGLFPHERQNEGQTEKIKKKNDDFFMWRSLAPKKNYFYPSQISARFSVLNK